MSDAALRTLVEQGSVILCCGAGGVGKTTTSAALGLEAAVLGRRAVVVTVDPARRLADALGLAELHDVPSRISGEWPGELWALMLDSKTTFDELVRRYAPSPDQAEAILANRFYRNISASLSGTQEYMATEKLFELVEDGRFDLVVVDTPPTRHALDFLDAPRRLLRFLDHRLYRLLISPPRGYLRALNIAAQTFVRTAARVVGAEVIDDAVAFFRAFDGMEAGFRQRAREVEQLLRAPTTSYVMVAAPRSDQVSEAGYFARRLQAGGHPVAALVVNRMQPRFGAAHGAGFAQECARRADELQGSPLGELYRNLAELEALADSEERHVARLARTIAPAPVVRVPVLDSDVHDLEGLRRIADHLFGRADGLEPSGEGPGVNR